MQDRQQKLKTRWELVSLAFELGYIIALPLLAFILAGKYLDQRFGTHPYLKLLGLLLAIGATTLWLIKRFLEIFEGIRKKNDSNKDS